MINNLYQSILDRIRKITKVPDVRTLPHSVVRNDALMNPRANPIIPFAPGRIYKSIYRNWEHDPKPLIFILSSNAFYTHAINIHYLGSQQGTFMRMIVNMRNSGKPLNGLIIYQFLKMRAPMIPKLGYRIYFTKFLMGKLVSDGISQIPMPKKELFVADPFVQALNKMIRPKVINKVTMSQKEAERLTNEMKEAGNRADQIIINRRFGDKLNEKQ